MSAAVENRVQASLSRHKAILEQMEGSGHVSAVLGKELSSLSSLVSMVEERIQLQNDQESLNELLLESKADPEMHNECQTELESITRQLEELESKILDAVIPNDEDDYESDAIIEVRAGTGGDEASLFAAEILEAYISTAKVLRWKVEVLNQSKSDIGGLKEGSVVVSGSPSFELPQTGGDGRLFGPYGAFKFESGVHRVQRIPINDSRIHTSACSVAVLPSVDEPQSVQIPLSDLKIETMRASGAGGQHVNTTDSAVRITHIPTGIMASIQDERSQHQNKQKALKLVTARVQDAARAEAEKARGETRSNLMGGGDRSERIRTYNFPQDRITDHRCKETRHGIQSLMAAASVEDNLVATFFPHLRMLEREALLAQLEEEEEVNK